MKRAVRQITVLTLVFLALLAVCRATVSRDYRIRIPLSEETLKELEPGEVSFRQEGGELLSTKDVQIRDGWLQVAVHGEQAGETTLEILGEDGKPLEQHRLRIGRLGSVYDRDSGGFTGEKPLLVGLTLFYFTVSAIMIWNFMQAKGSAFYSYTSVYFAGFSVFMLACGVEMLRVTVAHLAKPGEYGMAEVYDIINGGSMRFMVLSSPLILAFAVAMCVSNIALLRHERPRLQNVLGILVGVLLIAGEAVGLALYMEDFIGPPQRWRIANTLRNTYATVFVYFECVLAGSVVCGVKAARFEPAPDKDCILILGCGFRKDGTLSPLLKGRADRALDFWRKQKELTGREAVLIPSGGQGKDEVMPEGEAMRRYLLTQDVPEELIRPETASLDTYQNMLYSRRIIEETAPGSRVAFATTNYHVFRSGIWASDAGLQAEGMGSRTKWWFWPNAFMRECIGLLQRRWKQELVFLVVMTAFFALLSMAL